MAKTVSFRTKDGRVIHFTPGKRKRKGKRRGNFGKVDLCSCKKMKTGAFMCDTSTGMKKFVKASKVKAAKCGKRR
jgi:hypothetical protein